MNNKKLIKGVCHYFNNIDDANLELTYEETVEERETLDILSINIHVKFKDKDVGKLYESLELLPDREPEEVYEILRHNLIRRAAIYGIDSQIATLLKAKGIDL